MSWTVDGHRYEDYSEYQAALAARESRAAGGRLETLGRTIRDLEAHIEEDQRAMAAAQNDLRRQREINQRMQANVRELQRAHSLLSEAQQQTERRMNDGFTRLEAEVQAAQGEIHGQRVDLERLRRDHQTHVGSVRRQFEDMQEQLRAGLERAEQRLRETENYLRQEIRQVDAKFEEDLRLRLARARGQKQQAEEQTRLADQILTGCANAVAPLNISEEQQEVREDIAQAQRSIDQGNASAALALSGTALGKARSFQHRIESRQIELSMKRQIMLDKVAILHDRIDRKKNADLSDYFNHEIALAGELLDKLANRTYAGYTQYCNLPIEDHENEKLLRQIESQIFTMTSSVEMVKDMARDRKAQAEKLLDYLESIYGPVQHGVNRFAVEGDRKSPLIVECDMAGAKVNLHLDLEGDYKIDAYGHGTYDDCRAHGEQVARLLSQETIVTGAEVDAGNRQQPKTPAGKPGGRWQGIGEELQEIRRNS